MLRVVIIGGKLQGSEIAYLGKEAGYEVVLIDKNPNAPAKKLCDKFICADITTPDCELENILKTADIIIPTMENYEALEYIVELCDSMDLLLAFDWEAYKISSSKIASNALFVENNFPIPEFYPNGDYPYIAKPSSESGSHGIVLIKNESEFSRFKARNKKDYIIQEYIRGPSYSVEIIGVPGNYRTYVLTEILVDGIFDCKQVMTIRNINADVERRINELVVKIAESIELKGIMDLEVIVDNKDIRILEIDARFPSQTPIVVYHASGMNYVKELCDLFIHGDFQEPQTDSGNYATLIHYHIKNRTYMSLGEHIMLEGGILEYTEGICSRAKVISDYSDGKKEWRGTFISYAETIEELSAESRNVSTELGNMVMRN